MKATASAVSALALALLAVTAKAQIGLNVTAADQMYGSAVAIGKDEDGFIQRAYRKGGRDIFVTVVDGVIKRVVLRKQGGGAFSEEELGAIARREGIRRPARNRNSREGSAWSDRQAGDATRAVYDREANILTITKDSFARDKAKADRSPTPTGKGKAGKTGVR